MLKCFICVKRNCNENPLNCHGFKRASWSKYLNGSDLVVWNVGGLKVHNSNSIKKNIHPSIQSI